MRLSEKAYHLIKEKIITSELAPSSVINEQDLMSKLKLGRTPIREALQRLECEGLVNIVPRRGTFVSDVSITDLQQIFELRIIMEGACARLAARRITEEQLGRMEEVLQELEEIENDQADAFLVIDRRLHELLYEAADNDFLADVLKHLHDLSLRLWYLVLNRIGNLRETLEQHRTLVEALEAGNEAKAEQVIQQHIIGFQKKIKAVL